MRLDKIDMVLIKIRTAWRLGVKNIFAVIIYRVGIKLRVHPVCHLDGVAPVAPFFSSSKLPGSDLIAVSDWDTHSLLFSNVRLPLGKEPPRWLANPLTGIELNNASLQWWKIGDFESSTGDIKLVWEYSRMDWVIAFAQRARNGDENSLMRLNVWISDWLENNPPYFGHNWKCGQEASIRVIHLACAALILGQQSSTLQGLKQLIELHLARIAPTLSYAVAQNNNHGTSEAAALFIGGSWLANSGSHNGRKWENLGRLWLEDRANKLIENDGSFSQYSLNYHRMMLDTYSFVEVWRRQLSLRPFSSGLRVKLASGTFWLSALVSRVTGDAPNLGANDGARLLPLTDVPYRDYRPTVQLAMALFAEKKAFLGEGSFNHNLEWLSVTMGKKEAQNQSSRLFSDGGYAVLHRNDTMVLFRYPQFRYRPGQADIFHIDLWHAGANVLGDAGTFSYNSIPDLSWYFSGAPGHNIVQFDDRDQMPKLSRFLYGNWLEPHHLSSMNHNKDSVSISAGYVDYRKARHDREITLRDESVIIVDRVSGFNSKAILRWRLNSTNWSIQKTNGYVIVSDGKNMLCVTSNVAMVRAELVSGWKSLFYMQRSKIDVLEIEISNPGHFSTEYSWSV